MCFERAYYNLTCPQCGATGRAEWHDLDGYAFMRARQRGQETSSVEVSSEFAHISDSPGSFFGYRLVCAKCRVDAHNAEVTRDGRPLPLPGMPKAGAISP
jgi:hypothetical protein